MKLLVALLRPSHQPQPAPPHPPFPPQPHPHPISLSALSPSCRAMEFLVALLQKLAEDRSITLSEAASQTYYATLQHYHGWVVTTTFTVALKLVPSRWGGGLAPGERGKGWLEAGEGEAVIVGWVVESRELPFHWFTCSVAHACPLPCTRCEAQSPVPLLVPASGSGAHAVVPPFCSPQPPPCSPWITREGGTATVCSFRGTMTATGCWQHAATPT